MQKQLVGEKCASAAFRGGLLCLAALCALAQDGRDDNPDLAVVISGPAASNVVTDVTYGITISNPNLSFAGTGVSLADTLPGTMTFVSLSSPAGFSCITPAVGAGGTISCTGGTVPVSGQVSLTLVAQIPAGTAGGTTLTNTASIASALDLNPTNNSSSTFVTVNNSADLSTSKTGPAASNAGSNIVHTTIVTNNGPNNAINPILNDPTPSGLTFVSNSGDCVAAFPCSVVSMGVGSFATITSTYSTTGATVGTITNTASASSSTFDPNTANDSATASTVMVQQADLSITKTGPATAIVGNNLSYTITVSNSGPSVASSTSFADSLPAGTTLASATPSQGGCSGSSSSVGCNFGSVASGGVVTATVVVHLDAAGSISNTATVSSSTADPTSGNNSATASTTVIAPPTISKAFGSSSILFDGTTSLSFTVNNPNTATTLTAVGFSDALPAGMIVFTPSGLAGSCGGGTITAAEGSGSVSLAGASLPASGSCTFSLTVRGTTAGIKTNTTSAISSAEGGTGTTATASLTVGDVPPSVTSTSPANGAEKVSLSTWLSTTFSKALNPQTVNTSTFMLQCGSNAVSGSVTLSGFTAAKPESAAGPVNNAPASSTATFSPSAALPGNTLCTATITTGITDLSGLAMLSNYVWSFTTGATPDTTPPTVISTFPVQGATAVPVGSALTATFSEPVKPLSVYSSSFSLKQGTTSIPGIVTYSGVTATFTPLTALAPNATFTATINTEVTDLEGNALAADYVWSFTTGTGGDTTPPTVTFTFPLSGAALVTTSADLTATFSESMNPLTLSTTTFTLRQGATVVTGTVSNTGNSATFRPSINLTANTQYDAVITNTVTDVAGNPMTVSYPWSFTTGSAVDQTPVCLSSFAVLSGLGITSNGSTVVTGDIGVSPGSFVNGFLPGTLTGAIHSGDSAATQAIADLSAAYKDAVSRSVGAVTVAGDLGGLTFTSGLYKSTDSLGISSAGLTLDAKGNPDAIFIFQVASTLTTAPGSQITLLGGASVSNIFWQVGTSAALGADSAFKGSILANQSITLDNGASVNGRLLAQSGAVTLQSNTITSPSPGIGVGGVVNAASDARSAAAGSIVSVFGHNLGSGFTVATGYPLPLTLGGSSFQIGTLGAPLFMIACSQANLQIPWESVGEVAVTATVGGLVSKQEPITITIFAPGIFSLNQSGSGQGAVQIAPTSLLAASSAALGRPVKAGEYIAIFTTGLGPVSNQPATGAAALSDPLSLTLTQPTVTIGNVPATVTYAGLAPGFAGLYQVNVLVPDGVPAGDNVDLVVSMGAVKSNTVTIAIQ